MLRAPVTFRGIWSWDMRVGVASCNGDKIEGT